MDGEAVDGGNSLFDPVRDALDNIKSGAKAGLKAVGKGDSKKSNKNAGARDGLKSAEKFAENGGATKVGEGLPGVRKNESGAGGFYSGAGKPLGGGKGKGNGKGKGFLKKGGPMGLIFGLILGVGGLMGGAQSLMPMAIQEMIIEKFNSIGISSTMASDSWLNTQLNQGVRLENLKKGETANLFAFSPKQVQSFEKQGIIVVDDIGGKTTQITALLYEKDGMYIPVVGSDFLVDSNLVDAIKVASELDNIGMPISAKDALADPDFKNPYTKASKTWRGGVSGWFDNTMSDITELKLSTKRNRWARWVASSAKDIAKDFKKLAKGANLDKISDGGLMKDNEIENDSDGDGKTDSTSKSEIEKVKVENDEGLDADEIDTGNTSVSSAGGTVEGISKVLNSKAVKAASAIGEYGCALLEGLMSIYTIVSAYQNLQFLNLISGFLESVSKVKAGDGDGSPIHEYSNNLTTKSDTIGDNGEVVSKDKTAMESEGMSWLFGSSNINNSDASVRNVNFETIMSNMGTLVSNISLTASVYEKCGYVKAGVAVVDLATTIISFIPVGGQIIKGAQMTVKAGVKIAVKAAVSIALHAVIPIIAKNLANMMIKNAATEWFGEDLGNAIASGAGKYLGGNGTSGGQSPGSKTKVGEYLREKDTVIAEEAEYQRSVRSPFDIKSPYTFLGKIFYSIIPLAYSGGFISNITNVSNLVSASIVAVTPNVNAINENSVLASMGSCDLLGSTGAVGDAFCNPYIITDVSTMNTSPIAVNDIVHNMRNNGAIAANDVYNNIGNDNFNDDGSIKDGSNLSKYIRYCGTRTSQYGVKDAGFAEEITGSNTTASKIIGAIPLLNNLQDIYDGLKDEANLGWTNGSACVASEENGHWDEYKWYQRYAENQRLLENMNPGYVSEVTAYINDYYEKNPLDQSFEGTLARFSGMTKEKVQDTLALIDYYNFLAEYNPSERYAFGKPAVEIQEELIFDNENQVAESPLIILINQTIYADLRNRNFAA